MSRQGYGAISADAIGAHPDVGAITADPLSVKLARGEQVETIVLVQIINRPVTQVTAISEETYVIGGRAIGAAPDILAGVSPDEILFLGDGEWCGRPDDFGAAHWEADNRIISIGDQQDEIPYLPEQDRRATTSITAVRAANGDGALDEYLASRTTDGLVMRGFLAEDMGYSRDWIRLFEAVSESADPELDECSFESQSIATRLEVPALRETYAGRGGSTGDARLTGKYVPLAFGDCFNAEPDLESFADNIDRWTSGSLVDVTVLKDKGAPLLWDGNDHADYASLKNASVDPGYFTKALAIGRTKRGSQALGRITGDIRAPYDTTSEILLALARGAAAQPDELIDAPAFGVLPDYKVDLFLKGDRQVQVAEVFDGLLRPFNAWYGDNGTARLTVGLVTSPVAAAENWRVESDDILADTLRVEKFDEPPRWRLGVTGARNWTPMTPEELVDWTENPDVSQADWERLQRSEETAEAVDTTVKLRHAGAFDAIERYGALRGYCTNIADTQMQANALHAFLKNPMRKVQWETGLTQILTRPGETGVLQYDGRLELTDGRYGLAVTRRFDSDARAIGLTALVVVNQ